MSELAKALRICMVGWALWLASLAITLIVKFDDEKGSVMVGAAIAVAMVGWIWLRRSRASLVVTGMLGALLILQASGYIYGDVTEESIPWAVLTADALTLAAGLLLVTGAVAGLRSRSRVPAPA